MAAYPPVELTPLTLSGLDDMCSALAALPFESLSLPVTASLRKSAEEPLKLAWS